MILRPGFFLSFGVLAPAGFSAEPSWARSENKRRLKSFWYPLNLLYSCCSWPCASMTFLIYIRQWRMRVDDDLLYIDVVPCTFIVSRQQLRGKSVEEYMKHWPRNFLLLRLIIGCELLQLENQVDVFVVSSFYSIIATQVVRTELPKVSGFSSSSSFRYRRARVSDLCKLITFLHSFLDVSNFDFLKMVASIQHKCCRIFVKDFARNKKFCNIIIIFFFKLPALSAPSAGFASISHEIIKKWKVWKRNFFFFTYCFLDGAWRIYPKLFFSKIIIIM